MPAQSFVITGSGLVSVGGQTPGDLHAALCAGTSRLHSLASPDPMQQSCVGVAIPDFDPVPILGDVNLRPLDRSGLFAVSAAHLTLASVGMPAPKRDELGVDIGLTSGTVLAGLETILAFDAQAVRNPRHCKPMDFANTVLNAATGQTALWHDLRGASSTIASGSDAALQAMHYGSVLLARHQADAMLAGGFDALCPQAVFVYRRGGVLSEDPERAVPFQAGRGGFVLGEGAAFVFLEAAQAAATRGAQALGTILGSGRAWDATRGRDAASLQRAMEQALQRALKRASVEASEIDVVFASASGSPIVDLAEARALASVVGAGVPVTAPKGVLGESLGASGALAVVALLETMRCGVIPGIARLEDVDAEIPLTGLLRQPTERPVRIGLVTGLGHDGSASAVLIRKGS